MKIFLTIIIMLPSLFFSELSAAGTIQFAGYEWDVKSGFSGPGPNHWSDSTENVWVDNNGRLHLKIRKTGAIWYCAEIKTKTPVKYGIQRFKIEGRLDQLDRNAVFAMFLYKDDTHEIDIEFSKWGNPNSIFNSQYVVQPAFNAGNLYRFQTNLNGLYSTHYMNWQDDFIGFKSIHGHYDEPPEPSYLIEKWLYNGDNNFDQGTKPHIHINLWLKNGLEPFDGDEIEVIIHDAQLSIDDDPSVTVPAAGKPALLVIFVLLILCTLSVRKKQFF